jgi:hypothetical protein
VIQLAIAILGCLSASCIAAGGELSGPGFVLALAAQPLWIRETWRARAWGMLAMSIWYTGVWAYGAARVWGWV